MGNFLNNITGFANYITSNFSIDWVLKFIVIYFFVIWFAFVIWVIKDITNRTTNVLLHLLAVILVLVFTPLFWLPIYLLMRPSSTLWDRFEAQEWGNCNSEQSEEFNYFCYACDGYINEDFRFCPSCKTQLIDECKKCDKPIQTDWQVCPYCWEEISQKENVSTEDKKIKKEEVIGDKIV